MPQETCYRLPLSTLAEPLINSWAVWSDLVSPATHSLHVANYQVPLLESFLAKPAMHEKACRTPDLRSGRVVNVPPARMAEIGGLLERTRSVEAGNLTLAAAMHEASAMLAQQATGQGLDPLYEQLPTALRGYVELLYDYQSHPILRLLEPFLYRSPFYPVGLQSLRLSRYERDGARAFFLNTPRLSEPTEFDWPVSFAAAEVDRLFELDRQPKPLHAIANDLRLPADAVAGLQPFLEAVTDGDAPRVAAAPANPAVLRLRYFGHACMLLEWNGIAIMTDPFISVRPLQGGEPRFSFDDLPDRIDFALITHGHHDHFMLETLLRLRGRIGTLVVPKSHRLFYADVDLELMARQLGFRNVVSLDTLSALPFPGGEIVGAPFFGEHADLAHAKSAYVVRTGAGTVMLCADANCIEPNIYRFLAAETGPIDTVVLGMESVGAPLSWLYGALMPVRLSSAHDQSRRTKGSDARAALALVEAVGARRAYVYAMGLEPWTEFSLGLSGSDTPQIRESNNFITQARLRGLEDVRRLYCSFELHTTRQAQVA